MRALLTFLVCFVRNRFRSVATIEAENVALRHQLGALLRKAPKIHLRPSDRALLVFLYRLCPSVLNAIAIVRPESVVRWHRAGLRAFWRWKSRNRGGRPRVDAELRDLIRRLYRENSLWGAPRIHGELLMLGVRCVASNRLALHRPIATAARADVEDVSAQPRRGDCVG